MNNFDKKNHIIEILDYVCNSNNSVYLEGPSREEIISSLKEDIYKLHFLFRIDDFFWINLYINVEEIIKNENNEDVYDIGLKFSGSGEIQNVFECRENLEFYMEILNLAEEIEEIFKPTIIM